MNWILEKCNDGQAFQRNGIFYGIDTIINGIIMTKNDISGIIARYGKRKGHPFKTPFIR